MCKGIGCLVDRDLFRLQFLLLGDRDLQYSGIDRRMDVLRIGRIRQGELPQEFAVDTFPAPVTFTGFILLGRAFALESQDMVFHRNLDNLAIHAGKIRDHPDFALELPEPTELFLEAVGAKVAIASAPCGGRFGMPHAEVIERAAAEGLSVWWTGRDGAVMVGLGKRLTVWGYGDRSVPDSCRPG